MVKRRIRRDFCPVIHRGSVLGPRFFLTYTNSLPDGLISIWNIFADDKVLDINNRRDELTSYLQKIIQWAFQWKMIFKPSLNKQANEVIFSQKSGTLSHNPLKCNNNLTKWNHPKHLGVAPDSKFDHNIHIAQKIKKV